ncbi:AfsR/SARP family transcriptional regulator [Nocardiopsis kunsanensis]|uniref:AfsR/SARP family transcriptional regulator n=1 Tax=Nocardiopsis kunsanensis TaxID=141693 RepID=UPI0023527FAC|nr:tetratricopeptide repeat protein [Nocardiopsis kunsanensis]
MGRPKERSVLALLAYSAGQPVSTRTLVRKIWGQDPPPAVNQSLQSNISRLRRSLARAGARDLVLHRSGGYLLDVPGEAVDLCRARGIDRRAHAHALRGEHREAVDLCDLALDLWSEEPLSEFQEEWARAVRKECAQLHAQLLGRWAESALVLDRAAHVCERFDGHGPSEPHTYVHMRALVAEGRHAEAIDCFARLRAHTREAQGTEPNPRTRDLHQWILEEADAPSRPRTVGTPPRATAAAPSAPPVPETVDTLRADTADFVGRQEEIETLLARVRRYRKAPCVQLITGLGGTGKTTLAVHAAHLIREEFDLRLDVELGSDRADVALRRLLIMVGVPEEEVPSDLDARVDLWRSRVADRRVLLLLDNVARAEDLVPLIPGSSGAVVLATARRSMPYAGAGGLKLDPLDEDDAAAMLAGLTQRGDDPDLARVAAISCGMPIALRVVTGQLRKRPAWDMRHLVERLSRKDSSTRRGVEREVFPAFADAFESLSGPARLTFLCLGLHPNPVVGDEALVEMVGDRTTTETGVEELLDAYFVEEVGVGRYRSHDLLRTFAQTHVPSTMNGAVPSEIEKRLYNHYLRLVESADRVAWPERRRSLGRRWSAPVDPCFSTPRAARQWFVDHLPVLEAVALRATRSGALEHVARLPLAMAGLLEICGPWSAAEPLLGASVEAWEELQDTVGVASALLQLGSFRRFQGKRTEAEEALRRSLALWRDIGDEGGAAHVLDQIGQIRVAEGNHTRAFEDYRTALAAFRRLGDRWGTARVHTHLGFGYEELGRAGEARASYTTARSLYREVGDERLEASMFLNHARLELSQGRHREAKRLCGSARVVFRDRNDVLGAAQSEHCLGMVERYLGDPDAALGLLRSAQRGFWATGDEQWLANSTAQTGQALLDLGRNEEAEAVLATGLERAHACGQDISLASLMRVQGDLHLGHGRVEDAERSYMRARDEAERVTDNEAVGLAYWRIGDLELGRGDHGAVLASWRRAAQALSVAPTFFLAEIEVKIEALLDTLDMTG